MAICMWRTRVAGGDRDGSNDREAAARLQEWARQDREREGYITARRTEERERLSVAFHAANHWGGLVLKALLAINSGALITGAALYTDRRDKFDAPDILELSLIWLIAGVMVAIFSAVLGYFNALAVQAQAHCELRVLALHTLSQDDEVKERIAAAEKKARATGRLINVLLWAAVVSAILSAALFLRGVHLMFVAL
jgi:hypothetical protein